MKEKALEIFNDWYFMFSGYELTCDEIFVSELSKKSSLKTVDMIMAQDYLIKEDADRFLFIEFWNGVKDELSLM